MRFCLEPVIVEGKNDVLQKFRKGSTTRQLVDVVLCRGLIRSDLLRAVVPCSNPRDVFLKANNKLSVFGIEIRAIRFPFETDLTTLHGVVRNSQFYWGVFRVSDLDSLSRYVNRHCD